MKTATTPATPATQKPPYPFHCVANLTWNGQPAWSGRGLAAESDEPTIEAARTFLKQNGGGCISTYVDSVGDFRLIESVDGDGNLITAPNAAVPPAMPQPKFVAIAFEVPGRRSIDGTQIPPVPERREFFVHAEHGDSWLASLQRAGVVKQIGGGR